MDTAFISSAFGMLGEGSFDPNVLRPFLDKDGKSYIVVNGKKVANAGATLRYDEWKDIDREVIKVFTERLQAVADLKAAGLVHPLGSIGLTVSLWEMESDMTEADIDMAGITPGEEDTPAYDQAQVPVPVIHKDFRLNWRRLEASRMFGEALDVTAPSIATRRVAERAEDLLLSGAPIQVEGGTIYGYTTHPARNLVDMALPWNDPSATGADILDDVQQMLEAARADNRHGPFVLYIPKEYEGVLDNDYNPATSDTRTVRERLMQLAGISRITVLDRLEANNVLLIQLDRETVDWAEAQDISTLQWDGKFALQKFFKVLTVATPRVKNDYDGRSGIVHLTPIPTA